jgi:hypothetical protein
MSTTSGRGIVMYQRLWILFAVAQFPVTISFLVLIDLHLYWWLAASLGAEIIPLSIFMRLRRYSHNLTTGDR